MCMLYSTSFLPYGRFYNRLGGNVGMLGAYMYIFVYLTFPFFRKPIYIDVYYSDLFLRLSRLKS